MITLKNGYKLWVSKIGEGEEKILILHGGPGSDHSYLTCIKDHIDLKRFQLIYFDQLGCGLSDKPHDPSLWTLSRYVEEVEEVRVALNLDSFILYGHSWGALLAIEYALKYQNFLKGLVISNMTASIASYECYIKTLRMQLPRYVQDSLKVFEENGQFEHPDYVNLLFTHLLAKHILRISPWPDYILKAFGQLNKDIYNTMQGPNEFIITGNLKKWDCWKELKKIYIPTLVIGGRYDEMNPSDLEKMSTIIPDCKLKICDNGSHLAFLDDPISYFDALNQFLDSLTIKQNHNRM